MVFNEYEILYALNETKKEIENSWNLILNKLRRKRP